MRGLDLLSVYATIVNQKTDVFTDCVSIGLIHRESLDGALSALVGPELFLSLIRIVTNMIARTTSEDM